MTKTSPIVSVVLPTYNRVKTLQRAVDSALEQTISDIEVLVVDDGSSDGTTQLIESYDDHRLDYIAHKENQGGSVARNTGINQAKGKYIAFLDSDDEWKATKLEEQVDCLKTRSDEWIAAYSDYRVRGRDDPTLLDRIGQFLPDPNMQTLPLEGGEEVIKTILMRQLPHGSSSSLLAEREIVERIDGFDASFDRHQDWEFLIRLLREGKLAYVDEILFIKEPSEFPSAETVERAKRQYFNKFAKEIQRVETLGYEVTDIHRFQLSEHFAEEGNIMKSLSYLYGGSPQLQRQYILLGFKMINGIMDRYINDRGVD